MAEAIENPDSNFVAIRRVAGSARRDGIMGERPFLYARFLNGADGIGTGWSTSIPNYNPRDIVANIRRISLSVVLRGTK